MKKKVMYDLNFGSHPVKELGKKIDKIPEAKGDSYLRQGLDPSWFILMLLYLHSIII